MKHLKKIVIFVLILTFFYNVLGLYMVFNDQKEHSWISSIESTVDLKFEVFEIKINPYGFIVDSGFEQVNEDVIINNTVYHVFKNRIQNNILKLYCLKNTHQAVVNKNLRNLVDNQLIDANSNKDNPTKKDFKSFVKDYISNDVATYKFSKITFESESFSLVIKNDILSGFFTTHYPPPNVA